MVYIFPSAEETVEENDKENRDQDASENKRPLKSTRNKQTKVQMPINQQSISTQGGQHTPKPNKEPGDEIDLMQMTSMLKDLQSLSTALLTIDKESEDSQHSF